MEVWLLGLGALVLIGLTVWIVWPSSATPAGEAAPADEFDDRYTSATADLSAAGVAVSSEEEAEGVVPPASTILAEPILGAEPAGGSPVQPVEVSTPPPPAEEAAHQTRGVRPPVVGVIAAAVFTTVGAIGGAWLYARWRRQRDKPTRRLRRRFIK